MDGNWFYALIPLLMFAFLLAVPFLYSLVKVRRTVTFVCPEKNREVTVTFVERESLGASQAKDVCTCTAVPDMEHAACHKMCLRLPVALAGPGH